MEVSFSKRETLKKRIILELKIVDLVIFIFLFHFYFYYCFFLIFFIKTKLRDYRIVLQLKDLRVGQ